MQKQKHETESEYLSIRDVATTLNISSRKVWDLLNSRHDSLPFFRIGNRIIRVRRIDLDEWMRSKCAASEVR